MNTNTKRRKRRRADAKLKFGAAAVRKHMRKSGRTGGIWKKRTHGTHGKHDAQGIDAATAAETVKLGSVHESPVGGADAPEHSIHSSSG